ncbi:MAG: GyrI-like domain-containing protein [Bacteriovoracaceae bacterium]|nr:GyrI-like domain-containing protein [Bacteriovoracaceae bacterium]
MTPKYKELSDIALYGLSAELPASPVERVQHIKQLWQKLREVTCDFETRIAVIEGDLKPGSNAKYFALIDKQAPGLEFYKIDAGKYMVFEHKGVARDIGKTLDRIKGEFLDLVSQSKEIFFYPKDYRPDDVEAVIEYLLPTS